MGFVAVDESVAGWCRLDVRRGVGATRFLAAVLRPVVDPVVVIDYHLPLVTGAFELRAPGVWTGLCCETPLDHWTIGLEAFGLALPSTEIATPGSFGDRVPVDLDLDLDSIAAPGGGRRLVLPRCPSPRRGPHRRRLLRHRSNRYPPRRQVGTGV